MAIEEKVTSRSATNGGNGSDDDDAEEVETFSSSRQGTAHGEDRYPEQVEDSENQVTRTGK